MRVHFEGSFDTDELVDTEKLAGQIALLLGDVVNDDTADISVAVWKAPVSEGPHFTSWSQVYPTPAGEA